MAVKLSNSKSAGSATACEILRGGPRYFDRYVEVINESREVLHLQVYIFNQDTTGRMIQDALILASRRGVKTSLVLDAIGSRHLHKEFLDRFSEAGIEVRFFSKVYFRLPFRIGRRLHLKLLVADRNRAILGGINNADRYHGTDDQLPWLDFAIYLEGAVCGGLHNIAERISTRRSFTKFWKWDLSKAKAATTPLQVRVLENDFFKNKLQIRRSYHRAFNGAKSSLIVFASYFLPSLKMLGSLEKVASRGVDVKLVLMKKSDVVLYTKAVKYLYGRLLKKGIKIYEYPPTIMHAKVAVMDNQWCTIGSYNLNDLSDLLSIELNVEVADPFVVEPFQKELLTIIQNDCIEVAAVAYTRASMIKKFFWGLNYYLAKQILNLMHRLTDENNDKHN